MSKLESDSADYPPSQKVIELLATHLNLDADELRRLAGRLNAEESEVFQDLCRQYPQMPKLLWRMKTDPEFARKVIDEAVEAEREEQLQNKLDRIDDELHRYSEFIWFCQSWDLEDFPGEIQHYLGWEIYPRLNVERVEILHPEMETVWAVERAMSIDEMLEIAVSAIDKVTASLESDRSLPLMELLSQTKA